MKSNNHGGKRHGSGRKTKADNEKKKPYQVSLTDRENSLIIKKHVLKCAVGFFLILFKRNCQTKQERSSLLITLWQINEVEKIPMKKLKTHFFISFNLPVICQFFLFLFSFQKGRKKNFNY